MGANLILQRVLCTVVPELVQTPMLFGCSPLPAPLACRADPSTTGAVAVGRYFNQSYLLVSHWSVLSVKGTGWFVLLRVTSLQLYSRRLTSSLALVAIPLCSVHCWGYLSSLIRS